MEQIAISWLILELTDSPFMVALVGFSRMIPMFLFGFAAGSLADRFSKKRVMVAAQVVTLVTYFVMAAIFMGEAIRTWHAMLAIFITGTAFAADFAARRAFFSEILEEGKVANAVSLDVAVLTGSQLVGPPVAGFLIHLVDFRGIFMVMFMAIAGALVLVSTVQGPYRALQASTRPTMLQQLREAVTVTRRNDVVWAVVLVTICFNLVMGPFMQMVPVIARDTLGADSTQYGILAGATGVGALSGSLVIATLAPQKQGTTFALGALFACLGVLFFALSASYVVSLLIMLVIGVALSGFATMQIAMVLKSTPPELRGRAVGAVSLAIGSAPFGIILVGRLAEAFGPQTALALTAVLGFTAILILWRRIPDLRDQR
jgi:MFS family permease